MQCEISDILPICPLSYRRNILWSIIKAGLGSLQEFKFSFHLPAERELVCIRTPNNSKPFLGIEALHTSCTVEYISMCIKMLCSSPDLQTLVVLIRHWMYVLLSRLWFVVTVAAVLVTHGSAQWLVIWTLLKVWVRGSEPPLVQLSVTGTMEVLSNVTAIINKSVQQRPKMAEMWRE